MKKTANKYEEEIEDLKMEIAKLKARLENANKTIDAIWVAAK
jgi:prefoldin subunit 5